MKRLIQLVSLVTFGVMLGLLSAEILVRISGLAPQVGITRLTRYRLSKNPYVIYEPVPETPIGMDQANALGYRGPVYPQERTANTLRIVVAGDSVTEGLLVADPEKTYPAVLQRELSIAANKPVEVINLGVNGYNTRQEVETVAERGMPFHPDMVLLQYALNDTYGDDGGISGQILAKAHEQNYIEKSWDRPEFLHSALYRLIRYRILPSPTKNFWSKAINAAAKVREGHVLEGFQRLGEITNSSLPPNCVVVAIFPWFEKGLEPYPYLDHHARVRGFAESVGFSVVDLLPDFQSCSNRGSINFDHVHPNEIGHRCAGLAIKNSLINLQSSGRCVAKQVAEAR